MNDPRYRQITIRMLLDHTSGMPGTNSYKLFGSKDNPAYVAETSALLRESPLKSNPGDINVYCNDCFTVAQAVIERVSGMSLADCADEVGCCPVRVDRFSLGVECCRDGREPAHPPQRRASL